MDLGVLQTRDGRLNGAPMQTSALKPHGDDFILFIAILKRMRLICLVKLQAIHESASH